MALSLMTGTVRDDLFMWEPSLYQLNEDQCSGWLPIIGSQRLRSVQVFHGGYRILPPLSIVNEMNSG